MDDLTLSITLNSRDAFDNAVSVMKTLTLSRKFAYGYLKFRKSKHMALKKQLAKHYDGKGIS